ncbi:hypothetical protein KKC22_14735 [Myxococcota bacterium]|nr:hypothetical protein [Myxococcota bacterium]
MIHVDLEQIKSRVLVRALDFVNDPRVMKVLSHPRVMQAVSKGIELKEKVDATIRIWKDGADSQDPNE